MAWGRRLLERRPDAAGLYVAELRLAFFLVMLAVGWNDVPPPVPVPVPLFSSSDVLLVLLSVFIVVVLLVLCLDDDW